jgi:hypothetical protein
MKPIVQDPGTLPTKRYPALAAANRHCATPDPPRVESVPARFDCIALLQCRLRALDRTRPDSSHHYCRPASERSVAYMPRHWAGSAALGTGVLLSDPCEVVTPEI